MVATHDDVFAPGLMGKSFSTSRRPALTATGDSTLPECILDRLDYNTTEVTCAKIQGSRMLRGLAERFSRRQASGQGAAFKGLLSIPGDLWLAAEKSQTSCT